VLATIAFTFGVVVNGVSMSPTINHGDSLVVDSYENQTLMRGSIIVYERGFNGEGLDLEIKRIVGIAGDSVCVNWAPLRGNHTVDERIPDGFFYMRGDGGGWSSRDFGLIPKEWIRGVVNSAELTPAQAEKAHPDTTD
jgi:signal peptidase I